MILTKTRIPAEMHEQPHLKGLTSMYEGVSCGERYIILYSIIDKYIHIRIRREDGTPIFHWQAIQEIKDLLLGTNAQAVQVFPKAQDLVDKGNTYHLWSWDDIDTPNLNELYDYSG